ncbi:hypothetical protein M413DRAFT_449813 [Hebeloma cylindrosporum]|uniref:Uncharacterized protein n=1 Tax=Hebeloma cylindrosporum TaxID=76867 RepID=A0A0C2XBP4_HEBCY|nr:hypothetical protein M413DRAFT_449813 [Hebeloma cylindrosporum h7]
MSHSQHYAESDEGGYAIHLPLERLIAAPNPIHAQTTQGQNIFISLGSAGGEPRQIVVPLLDTYQETLAMGIRAFPDLEQDDAGQYVLKYLRNINGKVTWVDIAPQFWSRVIKEGDELRIFPVINEPDSTPREDTPQPLITFRYDWYQGEGSLKKLYRRFATTLLPNTYEDAQNFVLENLGPIIQYSFLQPLTLGDISLRLLTKTHSGEWVITRFDEAQWRDVMMQRWLNNVPGEVIVISSKGGKPPCMKDDATFT